MSYKEYLKEVYEKTLIISFDNKDEAEKALSKVLIYDKDLANKLIGIDYKGNIKFRCKDIQRMKNIENLFKMKTNGIIKGE